MTTHRTSCRFGTLGFALAAGLLLTSCATSLDIAQIEKEISTTYEKEDPGATIKSVTCPDSVESTKGSSFICEFTLDGVETVGEATVKVESDEGDIRFDVTKNARNVLDVEKIKAEIISGFEEQVKDTKVADLTCPKSINGETGAKTICTLTTDQDERLEITVTATDQEGNIEWEVTAG